MMKKVKDAQAEFDRAVSVLALYGVDSAILEYWRSNGFKITALTFPHTDAGMLQDVLLKWERIMKVSRGGQVGKRRVMVMYSVMREEYNLYDSGVNPIAPMVAPGLPLTPEMICELLGIVKLTAENAN